MPELRRQCSAFVIKRDGTKEPVEFDKIVWRIEGLSEGMGQSIDAAELAAEVISDLHAGISTTDLDNLTVKAAANRVALHPDYVKLASRIAVSSLHKSTKEKFSEVAFALFSCPCTGKDEGPKISNDIYNIIREHAEELDIALDYSRDYQFSFVALKLLEDCCLLKINGKVVERPQHMFMRVSLGIHKNDIASAIKTYDLMSKQFCIHSPQTLLSSGTQKPCTSSSFSLAAREDNVNDVYETIRKSALIFKNGGGVGVNLQSLCATCPPGGEACGPSNGLIPMLRVFNSTVTYVNQGVYKGLGQFMMYLEPWHPDILDYLDLRKKMGQRDPQLFYGVEAVRCRNLTYALWVPDLFMERVKSDGKWSLFCPAECRGLSQCYGEDFEKLYKKLETEGRYTKQLGARQLYESIVVAQIETGMPSIIYKDAVNRKSNQRNSGYINCGGVNGAHMQFSSVDKVAACRTASISLDRFVTVDKKFDFDQLYEVTKTVAVDLDKLVDQSDSFLPEVENFVKQDRAIGIGVQGLADTFIRMSYCFASPQARDLNKRIFETMYHAALSASCERAKLYGTYGSYEGSPASKSILQYDMWNITPSDQYDWNSLKAMISKHGLRNSLLISLMPTETLAQIFGNSESTEPLCSAVQECSFDSKLQVFNTQLLNILWELNIWDEKMKNDIIANKGSIENIERIPIEIRELFRTAWEIPQKDIIDMAAERAPFVDQSQSLNVFVPKPELAYCTNMHFYGWERGLKTGLSLLKARQRIIMINSLGAYSVDDF